MNDDRNPRPDDVPLSEGTVRNGGGFMGGESPADAQDAGDEPRQPLDSREAFGGDGAQYVDPAIASADPAAGADPLRNARLNATAPGEDGYEAVPEGETRI